MKRIGLIYNQPLIQDEISKLEKELNKLKTNRLELIENIKKNVFWLSTYSSSEERPVKELMSAALHYFLRYEPSFMTDKLDVSQGEVWKTNEKLPYYTIYFDNFKDRFGNTPAVYLCYIKDIDYAIDINKLWKEAVKENNTELSLKEFKTKFTGKKLYDFILSNKTSNAKKMFTVNCKELGVEDIIIVFPEELEQD